MTIKDYFREDHYAALSGIELLEVKPGLAVAKMNIEKKHLNAGGVVQGGAIFTLADLAFGAAINAYGNLALSIETSIRYFKGVDRGTLYAEAKEIHLHQKLASFEVLVRNEQNELIALFTATAYRKNTNLNLNS
jgi:acyl-CoA thioesterase